MFAVATSLLLLGVALASPRQEEDVGGRVAEELLVG